MANELSFQCEVCGEPHEAPLVHRFEAPDEWSGAMAAHEMASYLSLWGCEIEGVGDFLRGSIEIPVPSLDEVFTWDVWVQTYRVPTWGPTISGDAVLANRLPYDPWTKEPPVSIRRRSGQAALFTPVDPAHPLAVEQRRGMTPARVCEIARLAVSRPPDTFGWLLESWHDQYHGQR
ncbi:DUF2199 domain-containing protein [Streptodolium elevatio]|uniref:DUF2199 domain-containing protein n=1 Tax=Streptodolium elevatio TaxID=3157996 RepID=A0ABV3DXQ3_9ACTN